MLGMKNTFSIVNAQQLGRLMFHLHFMRYRVANVPFREQIKEVRLSAFRQVPSLLGHLECHATYAAPCAVFEHHNRRVVRRCHCIFPIFG